MNANDVVLQELVHGMGTFFITFVSYCDDRMSLPKRIMIHAVCMGLAFLIMSI